MEYKNLLKRAKLANHDYVLTKTELDFFVSSKYKFHEPILTSHEIKKMHSKSRKGKLYFGKPATRELLKQFLGHLNMTEVIDLVDQLSSVLWTDKNAELYALVNIWAGGKDPLLKEQTFLKSFRKLIN